MSVVTIQLGQCGNQVGYDLYSTLGRYSCSDYVRKLSLAENTDFSQTFDRWFNYAADGQVFARTVLVDTEQKVINDVCKKASATQMWSYNSESIICQNDGGSGNNWALGYYHRWHEMEDSVLNCIRKEVEKCDSLSSLLYIFSCAGGTGSGLGSHVVSLLNDEYPSKHTINSLIFPYEGGEIATQNYNLLFTLSKIYDVSDIQVIFQNDNLHRMCVRLGGTEHVQLKDLNSLLSLKLLSLLQPVCNVLPVNLHTIISNLTPHPCYKMVSIKCAPHSSVKSLEFDGNVNWKVLMKNLLHLFYTPASTIEVNDVKRKSRRHNSCRLSMYQRCIANVIVTRGSENVTGEDVNALNCLELYPDWVPVDSRSYHYHSKEKLLGFNKFVSLISNSSSVFKYLNNALQKAWMQYSQKAYVHHYTQYKMDEEDIYGAFIKVEDIAKCYEDLNVQ